MGERERKTPALLYHLDAPSSHLLWCHSPRSHIFSVLPRPFVIPSPHNYRVFSPSPPPFALFCSPPVWSPLKNLSLVPKKKGWKYPPLRVKSWGPFKGLSPYIKASKIGFNGEFYLQRRSFPH